MSPLIIVAAVSIVLNIFLGSFCTRTMHWANYWKAQYYDAIREIEPIRPEMYDWKEGWD